MRKQQLNNLNYSEAVALGQKENNKYNKYVGHPHYLFQTTNQSVFSEGWCNRLLNNKTQQIQIIDKQTIATEASEWSDFQIFQKSQLFLPLLWQDCIYCYLFIVVINHSAGSQLERQHRRYPSCRYGSSRHRHCIHRLHSIRD